MPKAPKTTHQFVNRVLTILSTLPWSDTLAGFSNREPITTLSRYLSREWLSDIHENQMQDLLRSELMRDTNGLAVDLESTYFWKSLKAAFDCRDEARYKEHGCFSRVRRVGELLAAGERQKLGLLVNLHNTHWVAVVVDFKASEVLYGDSLGDGPTPEVVSALNWWIQRHTTTSFSWKSLSIAHQKDQHSCGILSWNALAHHLRPERYALAGASLHETDQLRMETLLQISRRHLDSVSMKHIFSLGSY
ncbi:hypothetical protein K466DRAFT_486229 [Polyporus arcularius HHB13444]|uniref:Ubiquitin-like protease family profile domain-containing protein n=1 Tax=Polyporus arcularius HHB13444 TaxID=1314778 RepID=A0A5C3PK92_9APHY|nr:hypothetical protein K466DRAFT_486229 [Polyporus arcularius HHB13444]